MKQKTASKPKSSLP